MYAVYLTGAFGELVRLPFRWRTWQGAAAVACRYLADEGWVAYRVRRVAKDCRTNLRAVIQAVESGAMLGD
jgi:hypothetical protein